MHPRSRFGKMLRWPKFRSPKLRWVAIASAICGSLQAKPETASSKTEEPGVVREAAANPKPAKDADPTTVKAKPWCAPELKTIGDVCYYSPEPSATKPVRSESPAARSKSSTVPSAPDSQPQSAELAPKCENRTLVIFLHGLVGNGSSWQWQQQRLMARLAKTYGVSALIPHGRLGFGPGRDSNVWAWPTAQKLQEKYESELVAEWFAAKQELEKREGCFARSLIFGFSNGAYYATSLALRGRVPVDGYAVFAGGSGGKYMRLLAEKTTQRTPIFVGYGTKDPDRKRQRQLIALLSSLSWPYRSKAARVGHTVTDSQIRGALQFLGALEPAPDKSQKRSSKR